MPRRRVVCILIPVLDRSHALVWCITVRGFNTKLRGVMVPKLVRSPQVTTGHHGQIRGLDPTPRSTQFEGRFGRMFRTLPPAEFNEEILVKLGAAMTAAAED